MTGELHAKLKLLFPNGWVVDMKADTTSYYEGGQPIFIGCIVTVTASGVSESAHLHPGEDREEAVLALAMKVSAAQRAIQAVADIDLDAIEAAAAAVRDHPTGEAYSDSLSDRMMTDAEYRLGCVLDAEAALRLVAEVRRLRAALKRETHIDVPPPAGGYREIKIIPIASPLLVKGEIFEISDPRHSAHQAWKAAK